MAINSGPMGSHAPTGKRGPIGLPSKKMSYKKMFAAVKNCTMLFDMVPKSFMTREMCLAAVEVHAANIHDIPEEFQTDDFYCEAFLVNSGVAEIINIGRMVHHYTLKEVKGKSLEELLTHNNENVREIVVYIRSLCVES